MINNDDYNDIYYLPNIFTFNLTGLAFILIKNKLLLIPGHMIKIFLSYPIFNVYLHHINNIDYDLNIITLIKTKYILFNIIYNNKFDYITIDLLQNCIFCNILFIILINILSEGNNYLKIINLLKQNLNLPNFYNKYDIAIVEKYFIDLTNIIFDFDSKKYIFKLFYPENLHVSHTLLYNFKYNIKGGYNFKHKYIKYKLKYFISK